VTAGTIDGRDIDGNYAEAGAQCIEQERGFEFVAIPGRRTRSATSRVKARNPVCASRTGWPPMRDAMVATASW